MQHFVDKLLFVCDSCCDCEDFSLLTDKILIIWSALIRAVNQNIP